MACMICLRKCIFIAIHACCSHLLFTAAAGHFRTVRPPDWNAAGGGTITHSPGQTRLFFLFTPVVHTYCSQLLLVTFARSVRLIGMPGGGATGAVAAQIADGDQTLSFSLPWLLRPEDLDEINGWELIYNDLNI